MTMTQIKAAGTPFGKAGGVFSTCNPARNVEESELSLTYNWIVTKAGSLSGDSRIDCSVCHVGVDEH